MDHSTRSTFIIFIVASVFLSILKPFGEPVFGNNVVSIDGLVPGCSDGIVSVGEQCDLSNLDGQSCTSLGFSDGTLECTASCAFDTSGCTANSGGGGGGGSSASIRESRAVFIGKAHPQSLITLLKDAQVVATSTADQLANFKIELRNLTQGSYIFSLYGEDIKGYRSSLISFPVQIKKSTVTAIDRIFIAPTIGLDKKQVRKGDPLYIFGRTTPSSTVTLSIHSDPEHTESVTTDTLGVYAHNFDTTVLDFGEHITKARSFNENEMSSFSMAQAFTVGTENISADPVRGCLVRADINGDCRVNIVDFSIMLYWMNHPFTETFLTMEREKLNGDGRITIVDLSILAFYWTG